MRHPLARRAAVLLCASPLLVSALTAPRLAAAATLMVGPGKAFAKPCAALAVAQDNDIIEIDARGDYAGDVCMIGQNGLTLRGSGGRAKLDAQGENFGGKGIWVITGRDTTVENLEFTGASVPDKNGAGIRQEGDNLTVRHCYFHDNENGILTGASAQSQITVEYSEFANNGFGDGYSHNMYIGNVARFTLRYSYSHDSKVGHLVKSRAAENVIAYNRLSSEQGSTSYELDLPNGGRAFVIGNLIEQGANSENPSLLSYALEDAPPGNPKYELYVINNTFVNDRPNGGTFVNISTNVADPALLQNNIFAGPGTVTNQGNALNINNYSGADPLFTSRSAFDYTLQAKSPCIDQGSAPDPSLVNGTALAPAWEYVHPANARERLGVGPIDIGAHEFGTGNSAGGGSNVGGVGGVGSSRAGGSGSTSAGAASLPGGASNGGEVSSSASGSASTSGSETESGCACRASGVGPAGSARWLALLVSAAALVRRRHRLASVNTVSRCVARGTTTDAERRPQRASGTV